MPSSRRSFVLQVTSAALVPPALFGAGQGGPTAQSPASTARPNVAAIDHDRILAAAHQALSEKLQSITAFPSSQSPGGPNDFYPTEFNPAPSSVVPSPPASGREDTTSGNTAATKQGAGDAQDFTAHRESLLRFTTAVPALAAGYLLLRTSEAETAEQFAQGAIRHLRVWFVEPATRMTPSLEYGNMAAGSTKPRFEGILETAALAEVAVAAAALATSQSIAAADLNAVRQWFSEYLDWLTTSRLAGLARDQKDHHGSSWLLQTSAFALLAGKQDVVADLRHRFKTVTMRAQIVADGIFPHELTSALPYRNSLFNLDMLAASTDLLSTRFETLWEFQLQDGPGMRVAMARFFPYIERRSTWPYKADANRFSELPCRRPSLLFAARAHSRPEYADLWRGLTPEPKDPVILATFPIRQPLLWVSRQRTS